MRRCSAAQGGRRGDEAALKCPYYREGSQKDNTGFNPYGMAHDADEWGRVRARGRDSGSCGNPGTLGQDWMSQSAL